MIWTPIVAIIAIATLTLVALMMGYDGVAYASSVAVIGGLGGYGIKTVQDKRKEKK